METERKRKSKRMASRLDDATPLADLKARLDLLKQHGATYYKDGILELHLTNRDVVKKKPAPIGETEAELGQV